ncbi:MAG: hypothetical protein NQU46_01030 [Methanolinea sp.]|nr:hypothetical protein [Methanolinea sp.]
MKSKERAKKKPGSGWNAKKIGLVVIGVGFAVIMVVSSLGMGWLISLNPASPGDRVTVAVTFYDGQNRPVLTSNIRTFNATFEGGTMVWLCGPFSLRVGENSTKDIIPVPVYNYYYGESKFALFSPEYNAIAREVAGMRQGETKKVSLPTFSGLEREMTAEEFNGIGGNFTTVVPGDQVVLAFADQPTVSIEENVTPSYVIRTAFITAKSTGGVRVNYAYPVAELSVTQVVKA